MTSNNFEDILLDRVTIQGGLHLYKCCDAMILVDLCSKSNKQVYGIDAFCIADGNTHPKTENSIDLSCYNIDKANKLAYKFLKERKELDLLYEIVY